MKTNLKKTQKDILTKLNIHELNEMQREAITTIDSTDNTIILSPTGTGKTISFLLPVLKMIDVSLNEVQVLVLVPSRELAIQIEQVVREMGTGAKVNAVYGGRAMAKDKEDLKHTPSILIGTPGRVSDHFANDRFDKSYIKALVLDEFDKSLEVGFEYEMKGIINEIPSVVKRVLTSATQEIEIPEFVGLKHPTVLNYLTGKINDRLTLKQVVWSSNKNETLLELLNHIGNEHQGIIFVNLRDSVEKVSHFLSKNSISHSCFSGGMEQRDRERSLIKFRNGTSQILLATDLAARGIDIPEMKYIIHYELPLRIEEFTHRNGRTARVDKEGMAYVLKSKQQELPEFIENIPIADISDKKPKIKRYWETIFISGGRKDKISKGDIAGLLFKKGNLKRDEVGVIELKQDCAFVAVPVKEAKKLVSNLNNTRLKNRKVRIYIV
ncbi:DEAD/DEAH box helicase [Tenacibaculum xiamenense]|uniref:DEAD/DEAH box helicase n=1 Tax=Tenacibaculum xiamenense TaxID=1261553 RepID=UPI0038961E12